MNKNISAQNIAFKVMRELNGLKYIYGSILDASISSVCGKLDISIDLNTREEVKNLVKKAYESLD